MISYWLNQNSNSKSTGKSNARMDRSYEPFSTVIDHVTIDRNFLQKTNAILSTKQGFPALAVVHPGILSDIWSMGALVFPLEDISYGRIWNFQNMYSDIWSMGALVSRLGDLNYVKIENFQNMSRYCRIFLKFFGHCWGLFWPLGTCLQIRSLMYFWKCDIYWMWYQNCMVCFNYIVSSSSEIHSWSLRISPGISLFFESKVKPSPQSDIAAHCLYEDLKHIDQNMYYNSL